MQGILVSMNGKLYIVATPIGNLSDITFRAIEVLKEVDLILCEDTRVTKKLLSHYGIKTSTQSYHQHSDERKKEQILTELLLGKNIALVTDAGTPGISDPGNELIDYLVSRSDIEIIPIPGPSALTSALSICGLNVSKFTFLGFMPKKGRTKLLTWLKSSQIPFVFYESPYRVQKTLKALSEAFEYRGSVVVARELTKMYEEVYRGDFESVLQKLENSNPKGEVVVIIDPSN